MSSFKRHYEIGDEQRPGAKDVYFAAVPVGWILHLDKKGLVFNYVVGPEPPREPNANDEAQIQAQMEFCHLLGFCHLDITERNILLADDDKALLMDFDAVCQIGKSPLGPLPPESSDRVMRRDPVKIADDDHLWQLLRKAKFGRQNAVDDITPATQSGIGVLPSSSAGAGTRLQ